MIILGVNAFHGDVSAVVLRDGRVVAAVEEERFRRIKHWAGFPAESVRKCIEIAGIQARQIDFFAVSRDPKAHIFRKALFTLRQRPSIRLVADRLRNRHKVKGLAQRIAEATGLDIAFLGPRIRWVEHHPAHLASAFFVSPFERAAVCAIDGFGDFVSTSMATGTGSHLRILHRTFFPHSLGMVYLALTQYLGFLKYGDEYKVMGLAPYGEPDYTRQVLQLIRLNPEGRFELDLSFFRHGSEDLRMTWDDGEPRMDPVYTRKLEDFLGPSRRPDESVKPRHEAIAASLQEAYEQAAFHVLNHLHQITRLPALCLAGGCAMNSVANGKIRSRTPFEKVFIQPAAGDNGTALGAAFYVWNQLLDQPRQFCMEHSFWGPSFGETEILQAVEERKADLTAQGCRLQTLSIENGLLRWTARRLAAGEIVGWFQGRMEWGARALGNRSILADPRRPDMREIINSRIKFREKFRPFAPSILEEAIGEYFLGAVPDPFMIQVYPVRPEKRTLIPAVTHVDGSGRLQTVSRESNPVFWGLIKAFQDQTGVPVLLNTSFNDNEPIVHEPSEALDCFLRTKMDVIVLGQTVIEKPGAGKECSGAPP